MPPCNGIVGIVLQPVSGGPIQIVAAQGIVMELVGDCECDFHNCATADSIESPPDKDCDDTPLPKHPSVKIDKKTVDGATSGDGLVDPRGRVHQMDLHGHQHRQHHAPQHRRARQRFVADIGVIAELAPGASVDAGEGRHCDQGRLRQRVVG